MIWPKYANQDQENPMEFKDGRTKVNLDKKTQKTSILDFNFDRFSTKTTSNFMRVARSL